MEVVSRLPPPTEPAAVERLLEARQLLCGRAVSEEDCEQAEKLLEELGAPVDEGGFDYFPALLTLASLSCTGFEPAIEQDKARAARFYMQFLTHDKSSQLDTDLLEDAATQLCNIVREGSAGFVKADQVRLEEIAGGAGAGVVPFVSTWARFAAHDLDRQLREAAEDPQDRERRLARQAARDAWRSEELERQGQRCKDAVARAEELQLEGNDLCRQGQLPGNAKGAALLARASEQYGSAISVLSECLASSLSLVPEEANTVRRRRSTLQSNAAQVCLSQRHWKEARRLAKAAMDDDPENSKSWFRCARAEIELREFHAAAQTVDQALVKSRGRKGTEAEANTLELWKLAEEVSKAFPDFKWSSSKPQPKMAEEDFERRIVGLWEYQGGKYEIKIEQWGALVFSEETIRVDLMRKSKLTWRGEFEMIAGMALILTYEPGADIMTTQFIPPEDCPDEQKWKGPTTFTAKRIAAPDPPPAEPEFPEVPATASTAPAPIVPPPAPATPAPPAPSVPDDAPKALWLSGFADLEGCYELCADTLQNDRPVYRKSETFDSPAALTSGSEYFLWYRGGNWGVTKTLNASPLAAPFLVRCGDISGQSRHPLDLRRPRWYVRKGRGQEDPDPGISLSSGPVSDKSGYVFTDSKVSSARDGVGGLEGSASELPGPEDVPPQVVEVIGRQGSHQEVNGLYERTPSASSGMPVYMHSEHRLSLFLIKGYWVVAPEVCAVPYALARHPAPAGTKSPMGCSVAWEFLQGQCQRGSMVSMETRIYEKDSIVVLRAVSRVGEAGTNFKATQKSEAATAPQQDESSLKWPAWVGDASVELSGSEVKAAIVVREGLSIALKSLWLDVGAHTLKIGLPSESTLSLTLPAAVDTEALPVAKLSEKTRTLRVRLAICS